MRKSFYVSNDAVIYETRNNRLATPANFSPQFDAHAVAEPGFRIYIIEMTEDAVTTVNSWQVSYTFLAGHEYRVIIARDPEVSGEIANFEEFVNAIRIKYESESYYIPSWYKTYIVSKVETINTTSKNSCNGDSFVFFTDYHTLSNAENSHDLISYILKHTGIRFAVFGGDILNEPDTKEDAYNELVRFYKNFYDINPYYVIGNHEYNNPAMEDSRVPIELNQKELYGILCKRKECAYVSRDSVNICDYAFDNTLQKIRYVVLCCWKNATIIDSQIWWFADILKDTPNGYKLVVLSHIGLSQQGSILTDMNVVPDILDALKQQQSFTWSGSTWDFTAKSIDVIGVFSGHNHSDYIARTNANIPIISTTTDAKGQALVQRYTRNELEQAFDVVNIDITNRKIYMTRVGYGKDREISY